MNNLKIITEDEYSLRFPNGNEEYFNSMDSNGKKNYLILTSLYYYWLNHFITDKLELKECEEYLNSKIELKYKKVEKEDMDLYQSINSDYLNYYYIRSNIYIESLGKEEISFMLNRYKDNHIDYDEEVREFIEKSYERVIVEPKISKNTRTNFGPITEDYLVENGTLIIGFRYDDYLDSSKISQEERYKIYDERERDLQIISDIFRVDIKSKHLPFKIVMYDEYSIKKKDNDVLKNK